MAKISKLKLGPGASRVNAILPGTPGKVDSAGGAAAPATARKARTPTAPALRRNLTNVSIESSPLPNTRDPDRNPGRIAASTGNSPGGRQARSTIWASPRVPQGPAHTRPHNGRHAGGGLRPGLLLRAARCRPGVHPEDFLPPRAARDHRAGRVRGRGGVRDSPPAQRRLGR